MLNNFILFKKRNNICLAITLGVSKKILYLNKKIHFCTTKYKYMRKYLTILIFIVIFVLSPWFVQIALAQQPPPAKIPIDGGLGFILAAGVDYAARRLYKNKDKEL